VRKNDAALQQKFNAAIQAIRANGTYKKSSPGFDIYGK
jgi:ABC-type amino acid transport substrate-binding protein